MPLDKTSEFQFGEHELRTVRDSVAMLKKIIPVDSTLSTTNTAEDLINIESPSLPAYNAISNPSMEAGTPPTDWSAVGSTLARVGSGTVAPRTGSFSLQIATDNAAANEGAYFEVTGLPMGSYALSIYLRRAAGGTAQIRASSDDGTTFTDGNVVTMNDTWQRSTVIHNIDSDASADLRLYVVTNTQQNITYFAEDAQIEPNWKVIIGAVAGRDINFEKASPTDFVDPNGDRFSRWLGTANASASIREPSIGEIYEVSLIAENGDVYVDFDRTAQASGTAVGILLKDGETMNGRIIAKTRISFINATSGETPRLRGWVMGQ